MRVRPVVVGWLLAAVLGLGVAISPASAQREDDRESKVAKAIEEGRLEKVRTVLEEQASSHLAVSQVGEAAAVYLRLGAVFERYDRPREALSYYRTALTFATYWDSPKMIAEARFGLGRAYEALGEPDKALEYYQQALQLVIGEPLVPALDPDPDPGVIYPPLPPVAPLACGGTNKVPVATADLPKGGYSGYGVGATLAEAVVDILSSMLANTSKLPTCKKTCPSGRAVDPTKDECKPSIKALSPSVTPGDYGVTSWNAVDIKGVKMIGPVTITKIPKGLEAEQSCSACK